MLISILGYGGHVKGVHAENMFGKSYGDVSRKSVNKEYIKGMELPPEEMYKSQNHGEFEDQAKVNGRSAAQTVGVVKHDDVYKKPLDPRNANLFFGIPDEEMDELVQKQALEKNAKVFYGYDPNQTHARKKPAQSLEEATKQFHLDQDKKEIKLGAPIPGYSGVSRRVNADNIFGMTYAEARRRAEDSQVKIHAEKCETLKMNSTFVPAYKRPKDEDEWF